MTSHAPQRLPLWKKLLFSLTAVALFLVLLELFLALIGVEPLSSREDIFAGFSGRIPHFIETVDEGGTSFVRIADTKQNHFHDLEFSTRRRTGSKRVFCIGGSTTYGRPFWDETSFPGWLRTILAHEDPTQAWEVVNAGGISYASYRIVGVMRELAAYEPDVFVVYTGQNEFLEYRTYKDLIEASPLLQDASASLSHTRIATVMSALLRGSKSSSGHVADELPGLRAVNAVGPEAYTRDDKVAERVVAHFEAALAEMIAIAKGAGARIVFVVPASNLADFSPFKSEHRKGLSAAAVQRFDGHFRRAQQAQRERRLQEALSELNLAQAIDAQYAALLYAKARVLTALGRHEEATVLYVRAKDEDIVSVRAVSGILEAIRKVGRAEEVGLVDFEQVASKQAPEGVPGDALFADHVHTKILANRLLAAEIATWMLARPPSGDSVSAATREVMAAVDGPRYAAELLKLSRMLESLQQLDLATRRVREALLLAPHDFEVLVRLGQLELKQRRPEAAAPLLEQALRVRPDSALVNSMLGTAHAGRGAHAEALRLYRKSVALDPKDPVVRERLAVLLSGLERFSEAIVQFEAVIRLRPRSAQAHSNLGLAYAKLGRSEKAERQYVKAIELDPGFTSAHYNYGLLLADTDRVPDALRQFQSVLRMQPGHTGAQEQLQKLGAGRKR